MKRADKVREEMYTNLRQDESYNNELKIIEGKIEKDLLKGETDVEITNLALLNDLIANRYKVKCLYGSNVRYTIYWK